MSQDDIFFTQEGDAWFRRNKTVLDQHGKIDWATYFIDLLGNKSEIKNVVELGCSSGHRLSKLHSKLKEAQRFVGIDVSSEAIAYGSKTYPQLELYRGKLSEIPLQEAFDLVIVNFVLHWIDRRTLVRSIAEIDRVTKDGGILIIGDFLPDFQQRRHYHHYKEKKLYTYKQDYAKIFESLGMYKEIARISFDHDHPKSELQVCDSASRGGCTVLRKSLDDYYIEMP